MATVQIQVRIKELCQVLEINESVFKVVAIKVQRDFYVDHGNIPLTIMVNEDAQFIHLFGLSVDLKTGNIALGLNPNPNHYIWIGNIKTVFSKQWFNGKQIPQKINIPYIPQKINIPYILQLLKLDPTFYGNEIIQEVFDGSRMTQESANSITVSLAREYWAETYLVDLENFRDLARTPKFLSVIIKGCYLYYKKAQELANAMFNNFITEMSRDDLKNNRDKGMKVLLNGMKDPYLETVFERLVLEYKLPYILANDLKSYGFMVKERKGLFNKGDGIRLNSYDDKEIIDIGKSLSSGCYTRNSEKELVLAYNYMDMMSTIARDQNVQFSLNVLVEYKTKKLWNILTEKYHVKEILEDMGLSEKRFVMGVDTYLKNQLMKRDCCVMYNRYAEEEHYKYASYSSGQIMNAGKVFETSANIIMKSFA